jgi:NitT/TauT family transport system substrate-binding protein
MCSRCDGRALRGAGTALLSRRELLRRCANGAVMVGLSSGVLGASMAGAGSTAVRAPYGAGFCSLALFLAHARQIAAADGIVLELVATPTFADHVTFIGAGAVDVSVTPYTSVIALQDAGAAVKISPAAASKAAVSSPSQGSMRPKS